MGFKEVPESPYLSMKKYIDFNTRNIEYILRVSKRARHIRFAIYGDGRLVVTVPTWARMARVEYLLRQKSNWILNTLKKVSSRPSQPSLVENKEKFFAHKYKALLLAQKRVVWFNAIYRQNVAKITIRNQKTRWASCSKKGNLSFSYRIALLPTNLVDYIIVHELCHLQEFNHSDRFWKLVEKTIPDYKQRRKMLRTLFNI